MLMMLFPTTLCGVLVLDLYLPPPLPPPRPPTQHNFVILCDTQLCHTHPGGHFLYRMVEPGYPAKPFF